MKSKEVQYMVKLLRESRKVRQNFSEKSGKSREFVDFSAILCALKFGKNDRHALGILTNLKKRSFEEDARVKGVYYAVASWTAVLICQVAASAMV